MHDLMELTEDSVEQRNSDAPCDSAILVMDDSGNKTALAAARATSRVIATAMASGTQAPALPQPYVFLPPRLDSIPVELRERPCWVLWRAEGAPGKKPTKVP